METTQAISLLTNEAEEAHAKPLHIQGYNFKADQAAVNATKLIEAENKLNRVFEEYSTRIESFMFMLDTLGEGIVVINSQNQVRYTNETANTFLRETSTAAIINPLLTYLDSATGEISEFKITPTEEITTRCVNFFWNDEACNILIINKHIARPVTSDVKQVELNDPFAALTSLVKQIAVYEAEGKADEIAGSAAVAQKSIAASEVLLADLKSYISLVNYKPAMARISMQKIAGDVLKSMGAEIEDAEIEVTVSDLPETTGDKELIYKLLKQLVHNAIKFRNKSRKAIIDIGHDKHEGQFIFCVRDNGIGISKKHHEEVFNMFSRLSNDETGNGMGLPLCKKIVELHEGKIWVESLPGHGSNFYFKLKA